MNSIEIKDEFEKTSHLLRKFYKSRSTYSRSLFFIHRHTSISQKDIVHHLKLQRATVSELLYQMEEDGLIVREKLSDDKRLKMISLTPKGLEAYEKEVAELEKIDLFGCLDDEEKAEFVCLLNKIQDSWVDLLEKV